LDAGDVGRREVRDGAVGEVGALGRDPGFEQGAGDRGLRDEVAVREFDAWEGMSGRADVES
jgi:hypothetical protein